MIFKTILLSEKAIKKRRYCIESFGICECLERPKPRNHTDLEIRRLARLVMVKTAVDAHNGYILRTYVLCTYIEEEEREEEE